MTNDEAAATKQAQPHSPQPHLTNLQPNHHSPSIQVVVRNPPPVQQPSTHLLPTLAPKPSPTPEPPTLPLETPSTPSTTNPRWPRRPPPRISTLPVSLDPHINAPHLAAKTPSATFWPRTPIASDSLAPHVFPQTPQARTATLSSSGLLKPTLPYTHSLPSQASPPFHAPSRSPPSLPTRVLSSRAQSTCLTRPWLTTYHSRLPQHQSSLSTILRSHRTSDIK
jgi:hypothetical protein